MTRAYSQLLASSHCAILLVLTAAITAAGDPRQERPSIDLAGAWQFQIDPDDRGLVEKWYEDAKPFGRTITVPSAWNAQGVEFETPAQLERYLAHPPEAPLAGPVNEAAKLFHVYPGPAWYRRSVDLPAQWLGKTVWLRFGGVHRSAQVWVDGQFVGAYGLCRPVSTGRHAVCHSGPAGNCHGARRCSSQPRGGPAVGLHGHAGFSVRHVGRHPSGRVARGDCRHLDRGPAGRAPGGAADGRSAHHSGDSGRRACGRRVAHIGPGPGWRWSSCRQRE